MVGVKLHDAGEIAVQSAAVATLYEIVPLTVYVFGANWMVTEVLAVRVTWQVVAVPVQPPPDQLDT